MVSMLGFGNAYRTYSPMVDIHLLSAEDQALLRRRDALLLLDLHLDLPDLSAVNKAEVIVREELACRGLIFDRLNRDFLAGQSTDAA